MNIQKEITDLEEKLSNLKLQMISCNHEFSLPIGGKKLIYESYFTGEYEKNGIHMHPIMGSSPKDVLIWTRTCKKCGFSQETDKVQEVYRKVEYAPKFD